MDNIQVMDAEIAEEVQTGEKQQAEAVYTPKPVYDFFKRSFDVICSVLALIVLSPLFLIISIVIMIDDFGNPFFVQERTGMGFKNFRMIKFRSMRLNAEKERDSLLSQNEAE